MTRLHTIPQDPFFVGLDRIFDRMHASNLTDKQQNYPPYNIIKTNDYSYVIELALAGFTEDQLDIVVEDGVTHVTGDPLDSIDRDYIHKGISGRKFKRSFTLADTVEVKGADFVDGVLSISLENVIPDEEKPRKISIGSGKKEFLTED